MTGWWMVDDLRQFLLIWLGISVGLNALLAVGSDSSAKRVFHLICAVLVAWVFWMVRHSTMVPS